MGDAGRGFVMRSTTHCSPPLAFGPVTHSHLLKRDSADSGRRMGGHELRLQKQNNRPEREGRLEAVGGEQGPSLVSVEVLADRDGLARLGRVLGDHARAAAGPTVSLPTFVTAAFNSTGIRLTS